jgi:hypothetical protein
VAQDRGLVDPARKNELIKKIISGAAEIKKAFQWEDGYWEDAQQDGLYLNRQRAVDEDREEGPLPAGGYIFQLNEHQVIVAVERPGSRDDTARRGGRRADMDDEILF